MKVLKWIGIILVVLIAVFLIFSASQAGKIELEESITINAPAEQVYAEIADFRKWKAWSTWAQLDSNMKSEFSEEMGVVGAWNQWWSDNPQVGNGRQEVIEIRENEYTKVALNFEGMEEAVHAEMILEEVEGATKLRWTFEGNDMPFYLGWLNAMIEPALRINYQSSLKNLKEYIEAMPAEAALPEGVELVTLEDRAYISVTDSGDGESMSRLLGQLYTELGIYASTTEGVETIDMPFAIWHEYSPEMVVIEAARFISGEAEEKGRVKVKTMAAGQYLKGVSYGDYEACEKVHIIIDDFVNASSYEMTAPAWEYYANDPTLVDSAEIETQIFYPVVMN